jgi:hypothetical protein
MNTGSVAHRTDTELTFFFEPEAAAKCGVLKETEKVHMEDENATSSSFH